MKYYRLSADQGYVDAQLRLGLCLFHGEGDRIDLIEAARYLRHAADRNNMDA
jgi:TPR repeat protein